MANFQRVQSLLIKHWKSVGLKLGLVYRIFIKWFNEKFERSALKDHNITLEVKTKWQRKIKW